MSLVIDTYEGITGDTVTRRKVRCPFHDDSHASMQLYADSWHCFVCGTGGDAAKMLAMHLKVPYHLARKQLGTQSLSSDCGIVGRRSSSRKERFTPKWRANA